MTNMLPQDGTIIAENWNYLFDFLIGLSLFFFVPIVIFTAYFVYKYHHKRSPEPTDIHGHLSLEILWTVVPTVLVMVVFFWGWFMYKKMIESPKNSYEVRVIGKQWLWEFHYDNGKKTIGELVVPANRSVRLIMTSEDVLHSFFIPDFRIKADVVPGAYSSIWFHAREPGEHVVFCSEYCGLSHSSMLAKVKALNDEDWKEWLNGTGESEDDDMPLVQLGEKLMATKGCVACHSSDGTRRIGPSYKGLYGKMEEMSDGSKVLVDDNYIRESIEYPGGSKARIVKGYDPVMPSFKGLLTERELLAIIEYIKSLK